MRSLVMSASARLRTTCMRSTFILTGVTSWMNGKTKAPLLITTFSPNKPVRTNDTSFDERRYSQLTKYTTIAITMTATINQMIRLPKVAADILPSSSPRRGAVFFLVPLDFFDAFELLHLCAERAFHGQTLHGRGAVKTIAVA